MNRELAPAASPDPADDDRANWLADGDDALAGGSSLSALKLADAPENLLRDLAYAYRVRRALRRRAQSDGFAPEGIPSAGVNFAGARSALTCPHDDDGTPQGNGADSEGLHRLYDFLAPPQGPDEIGRLGGYRVLKLLGAGGMGVVFLAEDSQLKRLVALKVMKPALAAGSSCRQRFLREAQATAAVKSDHIVTLHQVGDDGGLAWLAMEFLEGESLHQRLLRQPGPSISDILRIGRQSALGLAAAHSRGLIHRDIKPANIWLERRRDCEVTGGRGEGGCRDAETPRRGDSESRVKLLDFGLARIVDESAQLTQTGAIVGTPAYIAPEQASGLPADERSDLFSLGCVLYRLCTGKAPFQGADTLSTLAALALLDPRPPRDVNPDVPPALSDLIVHLLARKPADRTASARAVAAALAEIEDGLSARAGALSVAAVVPLLSSRRRGWSSAIAALACVAIVAATVLTLKTRHGTLTVDVMEPDVQVVVDGDKKVTIDSKKAGRVELFPGEHELIVKRGDEELLTTSFTLKSGGEALVVARWVAREGEAVSAGVLSGDDAESTADESPTTTHDSPLTTHQDDAWIHVVSSLRAELQVEAFKDELKRRSPGFDDSVQAVIKDGVVITLMFPTDRVADIQPVRVFGGLKALNCYGKEQGQLSDLSPLSEMVLHSLQFSNNRVDDLAPLAKMSTLRLLHSSNNPIKDLSPLAGLPLQELLCDVSQVDDLSPLAAVIQT